MLGFVLKVWGLAKPYRLRLFMGVVAGVINGIMAPVLILTVMFVYGAIFQSGDSVPGVYSLNNNVVTWPAMTLTNGGSASFTISLGASAKKNGAAASPEIKTSVSPAADVFVLVSGRTNSGAGNNFIYTIVVTNAGPVAVSNVVVKNDFPTNLVFSGASAAAFMPAQLPIRGMPLFLQEWLSNVRAALTSGVQTHHWALVGLIVMIPMLVLVRGIFAYLNVYCLQWVASRTVADLRTRLFAHLMNLSARFYTENSSGILISRVVNDTNMLQGVLSNVTSVIVRDPIALVGIVVMLFHQQPKLSLIATFVLPACIIPIAIYSRKVRRATGEMQGRTGELTQIMSEAFTGHRVVKAYNLEKIVADQFRIITARTVGNYMRIVRAAEIPSAFIEFFGAIGIALLLTYLIHSTQSRPNPTVFISLIGSIFFMYSPIKNITRLQNQLVQARAAGERAFSLLATENSVPEPASPKPIHATGADIEFDHVYFSYRERQNPERRGAARFDPVNFPHREKMVLEDINLKIKSGQLVALVGASGSGKTTLSNLLLRFYDPKQGAIRIGGTDIREFSTRDLRNQIAVVTQENVLFNETIRRNIELGRLGASNDEIIAAAKSANAHGFIMEKQSGYDSIIGEKGVALSGGQRQRLGIARALLRNAPILILDEATSALDTQSEREVQKELDALMAGRTTLCIAHRLSTILHADMIVVLEHGRIVETGSHEELVERGGVYQKLYKLQFRE